MKAKNYDLCLRRLFPYPDVSVRQIIDSCKSGFNICRSDEQSCRSEADLAHKQMLCVQSRVLEIDRIAVSEPMQSARKVMQSCDVRAAATFCVVHNTSDAYLTVEHNQ